MSFKIINQKKLDKNKVKLDLEITNTYFRKQIGKAYKDISEKVNIPGFRKGKVPYQIIDARFGREYVLNEAASLAISALYAEIIEESKLNPIDYPKIKINQVEEEKPLGFEVEVELEPEITLPKYKGLELKALSAEVTDEELEKQIDSIKNNFASLEPIEDESPAQKGNYVTIDFKGQIEGNTFEGGSAEDYSLEIGSNTLFSEFEDSLVGMKKSEKKNISFVLPDDIGKTEIIGKKADFEITLKEIKKKVMPEINEEFLKSLGDYSDEKDFRNKLRENLSNQKESYRKNLLIDQLISNIIENLKDTIPQTMINNRIELIGRDMEKAFQKQKISKENYLSAIGITEKDFNQEIKERAEKEVKEYLVIKALENAESKNIEISEEDINKEKEKLISRYKKEEDIKKISDYFETQSGKEELETSVRRQKLFDFLISKAKIVEEDKKTDKIDKKGKIWTPDKKDDKSKKDEKLWTPDSE